MSRITQENNFCRVFQLPDSFPSNFCFAGGILVGFRMVDWFNPISADHIYENKVKSWQEYVPELRYWLLKKRYVIPGKQYILITDFGESMIFGIKPE